MKLLLDTHVFFWFVTNSALLDERHRRLIAERSNMKAVSAVTGWEIAIKFKLGMWPGAKPCFRIFLDSLPVLIWRPSI